MAKMSELVQQFNALSPNKPVTRFKTVADGERRLAALVLKTAPPPTPAAEPVVQPTQEQETVEMAKRKNGNGNGAAKRKGRPVVQGGTTIAAITAQFNELVPRAKKLGIKAKHHTSAFGTKDHGVKQLKTLQTAINKAEAQAGR